MTDKEQLPDIEIHLADMVMEVPKGAMFVLLMVTPDPDTELDQEDLESFWAETASKVTGSFTNPTVELVCVCSDDDFDEDTPD